VSPEAGVSPEEVSPEAAEHHKLRLSNFQDNRTFPHFHIRKVGYTRADWVALSSRCIPIRSPDPPWWIRRYSSDSRRLNTPAVGV
jgi:hypothetical protein